MSTGDGPRNRNAQRRPPQGHGRRQPQSRPERRRPAHRKEVAPARRWWAIGAVVAALLLVIGGTAYFASAQQSQPPAGSQPGAPIDGIKCGSMEGQTEHIHSHVALFWNGKPVTIPAYVGIPFNQHIPGNYCFYWLHTHATTDVVHIEAPATGTYTLGQFIDIWHYTALWDSQSTIAQTPHLDASFADALRLARPSDVHVYVGGTLVNTPYRAVSFADHRNITVELGLPLKPPVATFDWAHWAGL